MNRKKTEISHNRRENFYLKFLAGSVGAIVLLIGICWGGHDLYIRWQEKRLIKIARLDLEKGDAKGASLAARSILNIKPNSAAGARMMAELTERASDRSALDWRRRVFQLAPNSVNDALALVRCAIQFDDLTTADRTLSSVNQNARNTAEYHEAAALLAEAKHKNAEAEEEWIAALRLKPLDRSFQLHLATLRFLGNDPQKQTEGQAVLNELRSDPAHRCAAMRTLIQGGVAHRQNTRNLLELAKELQEYPEATLADRLIYLDFLHQLNHPDFSSYLTSLEEKVSGGATQCAELLSWMSENGLNLLALDFSKRLSPDVLGKWPIPLALADIYSRLDQWQELEKLTRDANWHEGDFLRHAYLARAARAQEKSTTAEHEWTEAVKDASTRSGSILTLVRLTSEWMWENEMVDLLWNLSKNPEKQMEAVQTLYRYYAKNGDTAGLYRVLVRWSEVAPDDLNVKNNLAQVSLLLGADRDQARRTAAELYEKAPSNPAYATTYAYSLLSNGKVDAARQVMNKLTEAQLRDPTISLYYGICLAASHDEKARPFLEEGLQAKMLLPEEKALLQKALANLNSSAGR